MHARSITPVTFSRQKYGQPLAIDASGFARWTGIVPDGEPHVLDFHEFLIVSEGTADIRLGEQCVRVTGPTVFFTPPGVVRRVEVMDPPALELVVVLDAALSRSMWPPARKGIAPGALPVADRAAFQSMKSVAQLMAAELAAPRPDSSLMLDALLAQLMITLNRSRAGAGVTPLLARRFEALLDSRFRDDHDVMAYAAALGVSADHLSAVTRTCFGLGAKAMIERRLFAEASRLLACTSESIEAIAASRGFDETSKF
jgi:AraC family transcriptional regulator, transcriptional activator of pobA